jgi:Tol biopolymer transport system component
LSNNCLFHNPPWLVGADYFLTPVLMMRFSIWFVLALTISCSPEYLKFDKQVPGAIPKVFAKKLIAPNHEHVGYCAFSPDGSELYYAITNNEWTMSKLIRIAADNLSKKDTLYLVDRQYEGEPFMTRDGNTLYFMAVLPPKGGQQWHADQYRVRKTEDGWCDPERLDSVINTAASEWHVSMTDKNKMYFTSEREEGTSALHGDIYSAELVGNKFINLKKLPHPINSNFNDSDPLIAPDESFLIFHSDRPGGFGAHDLYISFRNNGEWSAPVNMGKSINTAGWEMAPTLTPDGKYFLYTHRKDMVTDEPAQIYWVSTKIFDMYR